MVEYDYFERGKLATFDYKAKVSVNSTNTPYCSPRRLSFVEKQEVDRIIADLLSRGIIRHSDLPYASPMVLTKKKSGERRMYVDYRSLNKIVVRDNYPLPIIEDCLKRLEGRKYFKIMDLKSGFHQVKMADESIKYTAFVVPNGQYEFLGLPFGLKNGPAIFQRFVNRVFRDFLEQGKIVVYMDDIVVASRTLAEHMDLGARVLLRLAESGLELKLEKFKFAFTEIEYLGYIVSKDGISPPDWHVRTISTYRHLKCPKT